MFLDEVQLEEVESRGEFFFFFFFAEKRRRRKGSRNDGICFGLGCYNKLGIRFNESYWRTIGLGLDFRNEIKIHV